MEINPLVQKFEESKNLVKKVYLKILIKLSILFASKAASPA